MAKHDKITKEQSREDRLKAQRKANREASFTTYKRNEVFKDKRKKRKSNRAEQKKKAVDDSKD